MLCQEFGAEDVKLQPHPDPHPSPPPSPFTLSDPMGEVVLPVSALLHASVDRWLPVQGGAGEVHVQASGSARKALSLKQRDSLQINDSKVAIALGWDMPKQGRQAIDLDTSCVALSDRGDVVMAECVYFAQLKSRSGALTHTGDEREGDEDLGQGDDEIIVVDLSKVPSNVKALFCIATVATEGKSFADVKSARMRLIDWSKGVERCRFFPATKGAHTALFMCRITRVGAVGMSAADWSIQTIGEVDHTARDWGTLVPEMRLYMSDLVPNITSTSEHRVAVMRKGGKVKLSDYVPPHCWPPSRVTVGLAWDVTDGVEIDLDASVIVLSKTLGVLDVVFFGKLRSDDGAIQHGGDEREGDAKGDDEKIHINLAAVHPQAAYLCVCINSYSGQELDDVKAAQCRIHLPNQENLALFKISNAAFLDKHVALCVGFLYREPAGTNWCFGIMSEAAQGRTAHDNTDEFQRFLRRSQPTPVEESRPPPAPPAAPLVFHPVVPPAQPQIVNVTVNVIAPSMAVGMPAAPIGGMGGYPPMPGGPMPGMAGMGGYPPMPGGPMPGMPGGPMPGMAGPSEPVPSI